MTPAEEQYGTTQVAPPPSDDNTIPFTGFDAGLLIVFALLALTLGVGIRMLAR